MTGWECALYLEKGHLFIGTGFGARLSRGGEAVFNTGMTGYQEIFTDPSYSMQIVVMTAPHIGNTGTNVEDPESRRLALAGVVIRDYCETPSSWRAVSSLHDYLAKNGVPAIGDVDTRELTRILRSEGAQRAVIFPVTEMKGRHLEAYAAHAKDLLASVPPMEGRELVSEVSCKASYEFQGDSADGAADNGTVVVYDYGVKYNILRHFRRRGFQVRVVPYNLPYQEALAYRPVAVALSNGPGDPAQVAGAVDEIKGLLGKVPLFAVCMGHQLLARALGAPTYKLPFGHHGINHPVKDLLSGKILITSQNHGFAVKEEALRMKDVTLSHVNLNDRTVEGFVSEKMRFYSVQFHPEAKPGPSDAAYIFDHFIRGFLR